HVKVLCAYVRSLAFSPDGRTIATASVDTTVRLWEVKSGSPIGAPLKGHDRPVTSVAFSRDGRTIASAGGDASGEETVRLWDAKSGSPIGAPLKGPGVAVSSVAFSPDGRMIASASDDRTLRLWDVKSGSPIGAPLKGHERGVTSVVFSPDGRTIASASYDSTVRRWVASPEGWLALACERIRYHPILVDPKRIGASPEQISVSQRARAACARATVPPTMSAPPGHAPRRAKLPLPPALQPLVHSLQQLRRSLKG
ncbi:MAG: WD40 repeat domain-containing protein, partial [Synechococcaceae cyanobacterium]